MPLPRTPKNGRPASAVRPPWALDGDAGLRTQDLAGLVPGPVGGPRDIVGAARREVRGGGGYKREAMAARERELE
eukprot:SAG31_NODE_9648_length_1246_cov_1.146469_1_plen_74_part_10